ncbi:hypothetical protein Hdeb2414_s0004g00139861 [Helianthus debilis subsp. tardiflorus]
MNPIMQGKRANEPDVVEFISAIAAGNNAQFMVVACAATAGSTTLGLIAASHQTGGRLVCIVKGIEELESSKQSLNSDTNHVEFVVGNAESLLSNEYKSADFVVIDCSLENHEGILGAIQNNREKSTIVLGCNAFWKDSWVWSRSNSHLLPIGEGLLMMRVPGKSEKVVGGITAAVVKGGAVGWLKLINAQSKNMFFGSNYQVVGL